ncbi:MAG TPA: SUF system Fe-S cluster assembly regulator [Gammaproteobacteria bacterium]|jgi:FeS assembly SUF system regulator|nr:SUF system Fe-S cluster assembly regulator [Gammaproteobacteria bacterium]
MRNLKIRVVIMLRIGKLTDYALLIIAHMAKQSSHIMSASHIAEALHLTTPTVSKILKILSEYELVASHRGAEGGYILNKKAEDISVAHVIEAMEGTLAMTECCEQASCCVIDHHCTMRQNWQKINKMVKSLLDKVTILDMLQPLPMIDSEGA